MLYLPTAGTPESVIENKDLLTHQYLSRKGLAPSCPKLSREPGGAKGQLQEQGGAGSHRCDNGPH